MSRLSSSDYKQANGALLTTMPSALLARRLSARFAAILVFVVIYSSANAQEIKPIGTSYFSRNAFVLDGRFLSTVPLTIQEIDILLFASEPIFVNDKILRKRTRSIDHFSRIPSWFMGNVQSRIEYRIDQKK